jgi:hypothetical protein
MIEDYVKAIKNFKSEVIAYFTDTHHLMLLLQISSWGIVSICLKSDKPKFKMKRLSDLT